MSCNIPVFKFYLNNQLADIFVCYSREHAAAFAAVAGVTGTSLLYLGVNPLTCYIGAVNYLIYTAVYTPMKRLSPANTWIGSVVGALPPVMGWTAATGFVDMGTYDSTVHTYYSLL